VPRGASYVPFSLYPIVNLSANLGKFTPHTRNVQIAPNLPLDILDINKGIGKVRFCVKKAIYGIRCEHGLQVLQAREN
jgi:hypothetical protein